MFENLTNMCYGILTNKADVLGVNSTFDFTSAYFVPQSQIVVIILRATSWENQQSA